MKSFLHVLDGYEIAAIFHEAPGIGWLVFIHGLGCSKYSLSREI